MKRAVLCVPNPEKYIDSLNDYSIMIINPDAPHTRKQYLLDQSDYSLKITVNGEEYRNGNDYGDEKVFWYTSGTTGDSKFYGFTQTQIDIMSNTICRAYDISSDDRYTSIMPLWHAHGQGFYWATKFAGCETRFLSIKEIKNIESTSPTFITAVPDILKLVTRYKLQNLRFIRSASAALPSDLHDTLLTFNVPVLEAFGMTEALSHCFTNPLHGEQRKGTIGLPSGVEAKIIDDLLYIKGSTLFTNDWFDTGDLADQDAAGYYRITGRHRDQINIKGYKINPASIERQLLEYLPALDSCVIFGSDKIKCIYVGDVSKKSVIQFLIRIHPLCRPCYIKQVEEIPIGDNNKISRTWLTKNIS